MGEVHILRIQANLSAFCLPFCGFGECPDAELRRNLTPTVSYRYREELQGLAIEYSKGELNRSSIFKARSGRVAITQWLRG